jgi:hypothetical protein
LLSLLLGETDTKLFGGSKKELAQATLLFHVEQIRETAREVKDPLMDGKSCVSNF